MKGGKGMDSVNETKLKDGKHISCASCSEAILISDNYCSNCGKQSRMMMKGEDDIE